MNIQTKLAAAALACGLVVAGVAGSQAASPDTARVDASEKAGSPQVVTFRVGQRGDTFDTGALWRLKLRPGVYDASFRATVFLQPGDPNATEAAVICGIVSLKNFGTEDTRIFAADSTVQLAGGVPAALSGSSTVHIRKQTRPGLVCFAQGSTIQLFQPMSASFSTVSKRTFGEATEVPIPTGKIARIWQR